jgi:hypothetical protein
MPASGLPGQMEMHDTDLDQEIGTVLYAVSRTTSDVLNVSGARRRVSKFRQAGIHQGAHHPTPQMLRHRTKAEIGTKLDFHIQKAHHGRRKTLHGMHHRSVPGSRDLR